MSEWSVAKLEVTRINKHYNADSLDIIKLGSFQVVARKDTFVIGDVVVFAPEKSVLPDDIAEPFKNYLVGPNKDRVKAVRLRGELSQGVTIALPDLPDFVAQADNGECLAGRLGITKYEPPISQDMAGLCEPFPDGIVFSKHDVEQFGIYRDDFQDGEAVVVTEKIHGTQINCTFTPDGGVFITSKGMAGKGLHILESDRNIYWTAMKNVGLMGYLREMARINNLRGMIKHSVQLLGEVIPAQAFKYGQSMPTLRIFDIRADGESVRMEDISETLLKLWVPILYEGPFNEAKIRELAKGREQVSGTEDNIKEGIVIRPSVDRRAEDGTRLMVKILNPKYKETGDEIS